jgi:RNA polymerase-binding transcription factor DksA
MNGIKEEDLKVPKYDASIETEARELLQRIDWDNYLIQKQESPAKQHRFNDFMDTESGSEGNDRDEEADETATEKSVKRSIERMTGKMITMILKVRKICFGTLCKECGKNISEQTLTVSKPVKLCKNYGTKGCCVTLCNKCWLDILNNSSSTNKR